MLSSQKLGWEIQALKDKDNRRDIVYEKTCSSVYELHIAIEEAVFTDCTVIILTKRDW